MQKVTFIAAALVAALTFTSCQKANQVAQQASEQVDSANLAPAGLTMFFNENIGKYPLSDLNITANPAIAEPLKKLIGEERFAQIGDRLTTETPIEAIGESKDTLQFSIGEAHNVPGNNVTVQYVTSTSKLRVLDTVDDKETVKE